MILVRTNRLQTSLHHFHTQRSTTMPLVIPGLQSNSGDDKLSKWTNDLMGKTIGDKKDATTFAKTDLPEKHRVIPHDSMSTMDHDANRLNIHTNKDGTVAKVTYG